MGEHSFQGNAVNMLLACNIVADHFVANNSDLSKLRTNWTSEYATGVQTRVHTLAGNYLGIRTRDELFDATRTLMRLLGPAKEKLALIKVQIRVDFKKDPDAMNRILSRLGFTVSNRKHLTQSEYVSMLVSFKRNLTPALIQEITAAGMKENLLTEVAAVADQINEANTTQERLKGTTKEATGTVRRELTALYDEIIGICKIASKYYLKDKDKKELFTFSKILANQVGGTAAEAKVVPAK
jgi:hypothetical protein